MAKLLIIDDSLFQRRTIRKILAVGGHDMQEATNGREGLNMLAEFAPDCVILDILMPDMDGLTFLKTLQKRGIKTPVIVLTADIQETTRRECLELGAASIIYKPVSPVEGDSFRKAIQDVLDAHQEALP